MRSTFVFGLAAVIPLAFAASPSTSTSTSSTNGTASATCYNLDGSEADDDVPCGSSDVVNCCNEDDICMSNGLCYQQGDRGMALSRGSCTDSSWGPKCYAPCSDYERDGGIPIVNFGFETEEPEFCCGGVTIDDDDELSCEFGDGPFTIARGTVVPGVAGLSEHSTDEDDHDDEDSEHKDDDDQKKHPEVSAGLAVALGVGIPLGLLVMGGVLWAVWERRRQQLRIEEEEGQGGSGTAMKLPGLHHRYGPIPSPVPTYSGRGTPTPSGVFLPVAVSPPQETERLHGHERHISVSSENESYDGDRRGRV